MVLYSNPAERAYQISIHLIVALIAVTAVFPLVYVIGMSMTTQTELIKRNYFVIIPLEPTLQGYERILGQTAVWRAFMISVLRSTIGPAMALVLTLVGAYCLSIRTLPGRAVILLLVLASIIFPGGLIPSYLVMRRLGLLNNFWVMILPFLGHSFGLLVIKVFIENLPEGLVESARIDGAGHLQMLIWIITPLTAPALAAIGMFSIVEHWNSWFDALVYLSDNALWPLQLILRHILLGAYAQSEVYQVMGRRQINPESLKMTTVVVGIVPLLCVYPFVQKHFIKGVYLGAIKG